MWRFQEFVSFPYVCVILSVDILMETENLFLMMFLHIFFPKIEKNFSS